MEIIAAVSMCAQCNDLLFSSSGGGGGGGGGFGGATFKRQHAKWAKKSPFI